LFTIVLYCSAQAASAPADLRAIALDFYEWNEVAYPATASSLGDYRFDARLTTKQQDRKDRHGFLALCKKSIAASSRMAAMRCMSINSSMG
jgi:hypothetical protein